MFFLYLCPLEARFGMFLANCSGISASELEPESSASEEVIQSPPSDAGILSGLPEVAAVLCFSVGVISFKFYKALIIRPGDQQHGTVRG